MFPVSTVRFTAVLTIQLLAVTVGAGVATARVSADETGVEWNPNATPRRFATDSGRRTR